VRHQRPDLLRVPGHQGQRVDRATAAGEDVHRPRVQRPGLDSTDQPVQVIGVLVRRGLEDAIGARAAPRPARAVGHHGAVSEVHSQGDEPLSAHRRPDDQQDRPGVRAGAPDVVMELGARCGQGAGLRLGHGKPPPAGVCVDQTLQASETHGHAVPASPAGRRSPGSSSPPWSGNEISPSHRQSPYCLHN
jgi:hypothetical protein